MAAGSELNNASAVSDHPIHACRGHSAAAVEMNRIHKANLPWPKGPIAALVRTKAPRINAGKGENFLILIIGRKHLTSKAST
jgi:hypothetical protein